MAWGDVEVIPERILILVRSFNLKEKEWGGGRAFHYFTANLCTKYRFNILVVCCRKAGLLSQVDCNAALSFSLAFGFMNELLKL